MDFDYILVGKFDVSKYHLNMKTTTDDVILSINRLYHIMDNHPEVLRYVKRLNRLLSDPDCVYVENGKLDTIWVVKNFKNNVKVTIRLNIIKYGRKDYKNSIIQMQFLDNKRLENYLNSNRVSKVFAKEEVM